MILKDNQDEEWRLFMRRDHIAMLPKTTRRVEQNEVPMMLNYEEEEEMAVANINDEGEKTKVFDRTDEKGKKFTNKYNTLSLLDCCTKHMYI